MTKSDIITDLKNKILAEKIKSQSRITSLRFEENDIALRLQRSETDRRLDVLNHAHDALERDRTEKLNISVFEQFLKDYQSKHDEDTKWREQMAIKMSAVQSQAATWIIAVGIGISVVSIGMGILSLGVTIALKFLVK